MVDRKGTDDDLISRVSNFITETGLVKFAYRSDREPAILTLFEESVRLSGREGRKLEKGDDPP